LPVKESLSNASITRVGGRVPNWAVSGISASVQIVFLGLWRQNYHVDRL
jgi:hypothetical protein